LVVGTAPEIGAANAAGEKSVAGKELRVSESGVGSIGGQVEGNAARSVTGGVDDVSEEIAPLQHVTFLEQLMNIDEFGRRHAEECSLDFHATVEREIVAVHHDGSASVLVKFGEAADVVDVRVGADDGFDFETVAANEAKNAFDFVAGIDDDALLGAGIADDGTVALQHADGNLEVNHLRIGGVGHTVDLVRFAH